MVNCRRCCPFVLRWWKWHHAHLTSLQIGLWFRLQSVISTPYSTSYITVMYDGRFQFDSEGSTKSFFSFSCSADWWTQVLPLVTCWNWWPLTWIPSLFWGSSNSFARTSMHSCTARKAMRISGTIFATEIILIFARFAHHLRHPPSSLPNGKVSINGG